MWNINKYITQYYQTESKMSVSVLDADLNLLYFLFGREAQKSEWKSMWNQ